jgi:predicted homoserine dehydrogenase-like protein
VRIGLVGAGFMGGVHLSAYANIPEVKVVGGADANRESAAAGAGLVGARPYASYDEFDRAGVGQGAGLPDQATERRGGAREKGQLRG